VLRITDQILWARCCTLLGRGGRGILQGMGDPRKHHYVPKFYLRRFANDREQLRVVNREPPHRAYPSSVKDAAAERDFYQVATKDGPSLAVEAALSELESEAKYPLERLTTGTFPPSNEDRAIVSLFLALQWLRGRNQRDMVNREYERFTKFFAKSIPTSQLRRTLQLVLGREPSDAEVERLKTLFADEQGYTVTPHQNESIGLMLRMAEGLGRVASSFTWQLLRFEEPCLLTSDAPVTMWTRPENRGGMVPIAGWLSDEVRFPLDVRHALILSRDAPSGEVARSGTPEQAKALNYSVASHGYSRIFHHPDMNPLAGLSLPLRVRDEPVG
jgi:uncharacterized protein DUF4238